MMIFIVFVVLVCCAHQALVRNFELWSCVCVLHASPQSTNNSLVVDVGSASVGDLLGHETPYQVPFFLLRMLRKAAQPFVCVMLRVLWSMFACGASRCIAVCQHVAALSAYTCKLHRWLICAMWVNRGLAGVGGLACRARSHVLELASCAKAYMRASRRLRAARQCD